MVTLVRQSSDIPNITNRDDTKMIRYAYGGYDGIVKNFGSQLDASYDGGIFKIGSGRIVLQGWEVDIDEAGWELEVYGTNYYSIYLEINLVTETAEIKSVYATGEYPAIDLGDDLTAKFSGTARILLYTVKSNSSLVQEYSKKISLIEYGSSLILALQKRIDDAGFRKASVDDGGIIFNDGWTDAYPPTSIFDTASLEPYCEVKKSGILCLFTGLRAYGHSNTVGNLNRDTNVITIYGGVVTVLPEKYRPKTPISVKGTISACELTTNAIFGTMAVRRTTEVSVSIEVDGSISFPSVSFTFTNPLFNEKYPCGVHIDTQGWEVAL